MSPVNLFTTYKKKEDQFTNGLVSILQLSKFQDDRFVHNFFKNYLFLDVKRDIDTFKVLRDIDGTADAELSNDEICCRLETKIVSGTIKEKQIQAHLTHLRKRNQKIKKLVLLTPDDPNTNYVRQFTQLDPNIIFHLEWKKVSKFFDVYSKGKDNLLSKIIRQYVEKINDKDGIFKQDFVGVIVKIDFGEKSEVDPDKYLNEMREGKWTNWHTPKEYKKLDGNRRKLLLYDCIRKAITLEVEISEVKKTDEYKEYPWSNKFVPGSQVVYEKAIAVENIRKIKGFENFGVYRRDRSPCRNLTHEQYRQLMKLSDTVT